MQRKVLHTLRGRGGSQWDIVIGLEVHAQIKLNSKLFSRAPSGQEHKQQPNEQANPNSRVAFFDASFPGTLPVVNSVAVDQAVRTGLALGCTINRKSLFERKHYFYSDLPHGYQITQHRFPVASGGALITPNDATDMGAPIKQGGWATGSGGLPVRVTRIQLEMDSGKSVHHSSSASDQHVMTTLPKNESAAEANGTQGAGSAAANGDGGSGAVSLVDLNRAGCALMEIVFEPDISSPQQAGDALRTLQHLLRHIGTCNGNMEDGSIRCDLNVSVRRHGTSELGERVEIKNMNSVKQLVAAAEYEGRRQVAMLEGDRLEDESEEEETEEDRGGSGSVAETERGVKAEGRKGAGAGMVGISKETRLFDETTGKTRRTRQKEGVADYLFMPEPDLPPLVISQARLEELARTLPDLPSRTYDRLVHEYGLSTYQAGVLLSSPDSYTLTFYETVVNNGGTKPKHSRRSTPPPNQGGGTVNGELLDGGINERGGGQSRKVTARDPTAVANWLCNNLFGLLDKEGKTLSTCGISPERFGSLLDMLADGTVSSQAAKQVIAVMAGVVTHAPEVAKKGAAAKKGGDKDKAVSKGGKDGTGGKVEQQLDSKSADGTSKMKLKSEVKLGGDLSACSPQEIVARLGLAQITDEGEIWELCRGIVEDPQNATNLDKYKQGKKNLLKFFMGQAMKATKGRADGDALTKIMVQVLEEHCIEL